MAALKFLWFLYVVYVSHTLNVRFTEIIVKLTSPEYWAFTYYKSVRGYSNSSIKEAHANKNPGVFLTTESLDGYSPNFVGIKYSRPRSFLFTFGPNPPRGRSRAGP